jgi:hypothetical protein
MFQGAVLPWTVKNFEDLRNESVSDYAFQIRNYMIKNFISRLVHFVLNLHVVVLFIS